MVPHEAFGVKHRRVWPALLLPPLLLAGCVAPPARVNQAAEMRAANDPASLTRIGDAAAASGDEATAISFYRRATELQPGDADAAIDYARTLAAQGKNAEAIEALQASLPHADATGAARLSTMLGKLLILAHRPAEAVSAFRMGLARTPNVASLLISLGVALDATRDFPAAQDAYRRAIAIEPRSIAARNDLGLSIALQGDTAQAVAALTSLRDQVARTDGKTSDLAMIDGNLALVYAMQGNIDQAGTIGAGATSNAGDLAGNMLFYSALAPGAPVSGALDSKGLTAAAPAD